MSNPTIPKLEPPNTNSSTTAPVMHMFMNGQAVTLAEASKNKYYGQFSIWATDKGVVCPGYALTINILGIRLPPFTFADFTCMIEKFVNRKVRICGSHAAPAYKPLSKQDKTTSPPILIDSDNWDVVRVELCTGSIRLGILLQANQPCNYYQKLCTMQRFIKASKKKPVEEKKNDQIGINVGVNPYTVARRQQFAARVGIADEDIEWIVENKETLSRTLDRIYIKYPMFKNARKAAAKYAKLIINGTADMKKVPTEIRKMVVLEMRSKRKAPATSILSDLGVGCKAENVDFDEQCHLDLNNLDQLKAKWRKEVEEQFKKEYMKKLREKMGDD